MACTACGTPVAAGVNFCPRCGAQTAVPAAYGDQPVYAAPGYPPPPIYANPYMPRPRVQRHLQTLGILWYVYAAYRGMAGLIGVFALNFMARSHFGDGWPMGHGFFSGAPSWMAALAPVIAVYTVVTVALAIFTGFSLLNRKPWGRTLGIVVAILALLKPVMGTALGIYTLWVLAPEASGMEYDAMTDRT
jgi:hypothetical protein